MTPINRIEPITRIVPSQQIERTEPVTIKSMKQDLLALQYRACKMRYLVNTKFLQV